MQSPEHLFIRQNRGYKRLKVSSIVYVEARKNFIKIVTTDGNYVVLATLGGLESLLPGTNIIRIHRSFLINLSHLVAFDREKAMMHETQIPLSEKYYKSLEEALILVGGKKQYYFKKQRGTDLIQLL